MYTVGVDIRTMYDTRFVPPPPNRATVGDRNLLENKMNILWREWGNGAYDTSMFAECFGKTDEKRQTAIRDMWVRRYGEHDVEPRSAPIMRRRDEDPNTFELVSAWVRREHEKRLDALRLDPDVELCVCLGDWMSDECVDGLAISSF